MTWGFSKIFLLSSLSWATSYPFQSEEKIFIKDENRYKRIGTENINLHVPGASATENCRGSKLISSKNIFWEKVAQ